MDKSMRRLIGALIALLLARQSLPAQGVSHVFTRPAVPPQAALDRLQLHLAWRTYVPLDGKRDNFFTVQIPDRLFLKTTERGLVPSLQVLIQTQSGAVVALNPDTGETYWQLRLPLAYRQNVPLGYNTRSVFAVNGLTLHSLDRTTGAIQWKLDLPAAPTAPPVADAQQLFLCLANGKVYAYLLPTLETALAMATAAAGREAVPAPGGEPPAATPETAPPPPAPPSAAPPASYSGGTGLAPVRPSLPAGPEAGAATMPLLMWDRRIVERVERAPLLTADVIFLPGADGTAVALSKAGSQDAYRFTTEGPIVLAPGLHGETAYVASRDNTLYAINIPSAQTAWTYTTGTEIERKPQITDTSVYVITAGNGLQRLDRATGGALWRRPAPGVTHFLAENPKFVYATDRQGRLLVLDRARGLTLSALNTIDFTIPIANDMSDRIFLAASDGLIVCLYDRDYAEPLQNRREDVRKDTGRSNPLVQQLLESTTMTKGMEETTLREAIDFFRTRYKLPIVVNEAAFRDAGEPDVLEKLVSLRKFENVPLGDILLRLLKPVRAIYIVQPDYIQVLPAKGNAPGQEPPGAPVP
jgi:outer membrane protein assembly factor BamB